MKTNEQLRKDVMEELKWNSELQSVATEIGVATKDGVVTLSGTVDSYRKKVAAEEAVQKVGGVKVVASDIEVKIPGLGKRNDTEIAEAVKNALRWNSTISDNEIDVKVDNGWVYLNGTVDWMFQKDSVQRNVEWLTGVTGVLNNIKLKSRTINTQSIKGKIAAAFHRSATVDSSTIRVETLGSKVILHGRVRSWAEKKEAERIALASPDVMSVENKIDVDVEVLA